MGVNRSLKETGLGGEGREGRLHRGCYRVGLGAFSGGDRVRLFV